MAGIKFDHVWKRFGDFSALKDLNIEINDQEFLVLVGPSGCGKTTALRCLAGLEEITDGHIYIGDRDVTDVPPKDRDIAMVFQSYALYPHMSVYENMAFGLKLRKTPKDEIDRRVKESAEMLAIGHLLDRKPKALSGGQRQRVALGRAIVRNPAVFLMDEPLSNLDAKLRVQTRAEISKLHQRLKTTFIYVTHDQAEAFGLAEQIVVMNRGRIETQGAPRRIFHEPDTAFVARFLGFNLLPGRITRRDGRQAEIALAGGACIRGHIPAKAGNLTEGDAAIACIRKEHVYLNATPGGTAARIRGSSFLGLADEFILDFGKQELRAIQHFPEARADMVVGVEIPPAHCVILPPENQ